WAEVLILSVRPQEISETISELKSSLRKDQLIISVCAGIKISRLRSELGKVGQCLRVMPNIASAVGAASIAICEEEGLSENRLKIAEDIFSQLGHVQRFEEKYFDLFTALCASGPAFAFLFAKSLAEA